MCSKFDKASRSRLESSCSGRIVSGAERTRRDIVWLAIERAVNDNGTKPVKTIRRPISYPQSKMSSLTCQSPISATLAALLLFGQLWASVPGKCGCGSDEFHEAAVSCCAEKSRASNQDPKHSCCSSEAPAKSCGCGDSCGAGSTECGCGCSADEQEPVRNSSSDDVARSVKQAVSYLDNCVFAICANSSPGQLRQPASASQASRRSAQVLFCVWQI